MKDESVCFLPRFNQLSKGLCDHETVQGGFSLFPCVQMFLEVLVLSASQALTKQAGSLLLSHHNKEEIYQGYVNNHLIVIVMWATKEGKM